ncbi:unnamed protein product [Gadus morhua 'NCC']
MWIHEAHWCSQVSTLHTVHIEDRGGDCPECEGSASIRFGPFCQHSQEARPSGQVLQEEPRYAGQPRAQYSNQPFRIGALRDSSPLHVLAS